MAPPPRLALKAADDARGLLDGAWWPRSRDLPAELPALVEALDPLWGRITRVAVNTLHWPTVPHKVPVGGHVVKAGWFASELDPHKILLLSYTEGRWDLLVIPPGTGIAAAGRLMAAATDPHRTLSASALMAEEEARRTEEGADASFEEESLWESEGGPGPAGRFSRSGHAGKRAAAARRTAT